MKESYCGSTQIIQLNLCKDIKAKEVGLALHSQKLQRCGLMVAATLIGLNGSTCLTSAYDIQLVLSLTVEVA